MRFFNVMQNNMGDTTFQTLQNARLDVIGELEAIIQYENHLRQTDKLSAQRTIEDITDEEKLHVGQLFGVIFKLDPKSKELFDRGMQEYNDTLATN